jgi:hypothetical protein
VAACVLALLEDETAWSRQLGLVVARVIDRIYAAAGGNSARSVSEETMAQAADDVFQAFEDFGQAEPEFAMEQMLHRFEFAASEILVALWARLAELEQQDPRLGSAVAPILPVTLAIVRVYDRAGGYASSGTLAAGVKALTGRPIGKIGRNEPCLCGSGKKYRRCCWDSGRRAAPTLSHGRRLVRCRSPHRGPCLVAVVRARA